MLSVENQKYLLSIANLYREAAILAVRENQNGNINFSVFDNQL